MNLKRKSVSIDDLSSISIEYSRIDPEDWALDSLRGPVRILVVSINGKYRYGSSGFPDSRFIRAKIDAGLAAFRPLGVVIDLTNFDYEWGNDAVYGLDA